MPRTMLQKIWDAHLVRSDGEVDLLYIDLHLVHEVTSPQAFEGLRTAGRPVRRPDRTLATMDHAIPTAGRNLPIADPAARAQVAALARNTAAFGVELFDLDSPDQGIVHVIGPELGVTQPGMTIVCGDSHTATHGAFGALAFGIGTSEVEHVLATQSLWQSRPKTMRVSVDGRLRDGVTAKDIILAIIGRIGTDGGTGHVIEYAGEAIRALDMPGRMTICNMSIEAGARAGLIAPDEVTAEWLCARARAPQGVDLDIAAARWRTFASDQGASFDREVSLDAGTLVPQVTWGTNPAQVAGIDGVVPDPDTLPTAAARESAWRALRYQGLQPGQSLDGVPIDRVFIGSCTNGRLEDLRAAAAIIGSGRIAAGVRGMVVPGSERVRREAESEGIDRIFRDAGFEWRHAGCSMCLGMNDDILGPGERCAATSNRNFEGRQGKLGRTHLMSPAMAVAAALTGRLTDVRTLERK